MTDPVDNSLKAQGEREAHECLHGVREIPVFRLGAMMCARKSTLLQHITNRETSAA